MNLEETKVIRNGARVRHTFSDAEYAKRQARAGGYRAHDNLVLTQSGAENITKFPFGPERNIVRK